ncbi:MAG: RluA family pseudouridine synthase [Myxococcota bacterium]
MADPRHSWTVPDSGAGATLAALVRSRLDLPWSRAKRYVTGGKVFVDGVRVTDVAARPRPGQRVELRVHAPAVPGPGPSVRIAYEDAHVVIIDKPAGVSSVPYEPRETGTAMDLLRAAWRRKSPDAKRVPLHVVHRIDKATSGLLAFAKSKRAELGLAAQLRQHTMTRAYLCVAHGQVASQRIESRLVRDRGDGLRGSTRHPHQGKRAVTHVTALTALRGATLCRITLETGKTHQIRIHLAERGHPLVGETVYIRDFIAAERTPINAPRLLLHAATLGFVHPVSGTEIAAEAALPDDYVAVLRQLGGQPPIRPPR